MMVRCFFISLCNKSQDHVRVSPIVLYYALYLHMWRAKMKKWCSNSFSFCSSNCQNATVAFHSTLFNQIKNCFWPALFKFVCLFFFFFPSLSFCTISFSLFLFFFSFSVLSPLFSVLHSSPLCSLFSIALPFPLLILWWRGGWRLETGLSLRRSRSRHGGLFAPILAWAGCARRSWSRLGFLRRRSWLGVVE